MCPRTHETTLLKWATNVRGGGSKVIDVYRRIMSPQQLELGRRPANSPELNCIELVLSWMEMKLHQMAPIYKRAVEVVHWPWKDYSLERMDKMCRSYKNMLWALIESKCGYFVGRGTKFSGKIRSPTYNGGSA
jgi:hypothetical protein